MSICRGGVVLCLTYLSSPPSKMMKRQVFLDHKVDVLGVAINRMPRADHAMLSRQLKEKFDKVGMPFVGGLPEDSLLATVRLDEIAAHLGATFLFGQGEVIDKEFSDIIIGSQR